MGCPAVGLTQTFSSPARRMQSATHWAAAAMCAPYAGSVLTLGMLAKAISSLRISLCLESTYCCGCISLPPAVDRQHLSRDPSRIARCEVQHRMGDVLGSSQALHCN